MDYIKIVQQYTTIYDNRLKIDDIFYHICNITALLKKEGLESISEKELPIINHLTNCFINPKTKRLFKLKFNNFIMLLMNYGMSLTYTTVNKNNYSPKPLINPQLNNPIKYDVDFLNELDTELK